MRKIISFLILLSALMANGQPVTMRDVFLSMPDSLLPYLSQSNRLDLLDYYDARMRAEVVNDLQGHSLLVAMSADSLALKLNGQHDVVLYLLDSSEPVDSSTQVVAVFHAYRLSTGEEDRVLSFFSHRWTPLPAMPSLPAEQSAKLPRSVSGLLHRDDEVFSRSPAY